MLFGIIAGICLIFAVGINIHNADMKQLNKQERKTRVLQREVRKLKKAPRKPMATFHGDKIANLGKPNVK